MFTISQHSLPYSHTARIRLSLKSNTEGVPFRNRYFSISEDQLVSFVFRCVSSVAIFPPPVCSVVPSVFSHCPPSTAQMFQCPPPGQIVPLYPRLSAKWDPCEYKLPITGSHRETGTLDLTRLCALQRLAVIEKPWFCLLDFFTFLFEIKFIWSPLQHQSLVDITTAVF